MVEKLKAAVYGFAIGDALGVPYEFRTRNTFNCTGMIGGGSHCQPAGTWSDDTSMVLATMESFWRNHGELNSEDMMDQFALWKNHGEYTPWGVCFDIGNTTARAIRNRKGETSEWSKGNGSLMRILPLAFLPYDVELIYKVSALTHDTLACVQSCARYVEICKDIMDGRFDPLQFDQIRSMPRSKVKSTGYVVDSLIAALWSLLSTNNYEEAVLTAVNLGDDTDTIGALTGGLAGLMYGFDAIPGEWIDQLAAKDQLDRAIEKFASVISA